MSFILSIVISIASFFGIAVPENVKSVNTDGFKPDSSWELVFEDNFDGDKLNDKVWRYSYDEEEPRRGGYRVNDAVFVENGNLVIRTNYRKDGKFGEGWYTGAVFTQKDPNNAQFEGFSTKYGYFEVRCKVPEIYGTWAAFWLMPESGFKNDKFGTGEDGAEIDIFESPYMYDKTFKNTVSHAIHIDGYGEELKSLSDKPTQKFVKNLYSEYHTYALERNENEYIFYIDGTETWRTKDAVGTVSQVAEYLYLSVEVGGEVIDGKPVAGKAKGENGELVDFWAGNLDKNSKEENYDFLVDYVRVYQKK